MEFTTDQISKFENYEKLLIQYNEEFGLLGPREIDKIMNRHIYNSLNLLIKINELVSKKESNTIVDIGSGAGLPGIPLAIALPNFNLMLVEPKQKRVKFLNIVIDELGLNNVNIVQKSIQEIKIKPEFITARAVATLSKLLQISKHLWTKNTIGLFLKGDRANDEIQEAKDILDKQKLNANIENIVIDKEYEGSTIIQVKTKG